jgi:hypothetical protein
VSTTFCSFEDVTIKRFGPDQGNVSKHGFSFGQPDEATSGPSGYLNELPGPIVAGAHFHPVDQFQVFLPSPGATFQRRPIESPIVHYNDAYMTYGPFEVVTEPLFFLTVRTRPTSEIMYMPQDRDKLVRRGRRNLHAAVGEWDDGSTPAPGEVRRHDIIPREADGASATLIVAGPDSELVVPSTEGTSGQFTFVLEGSLRHEGEVYGPRSLGWSTPDSAAPKLETTGDEGVKLLVMAFPYPATTDVPDPS